MCKLKQTRTKLCVIYDLPYKIQNVNKSTKKKKKKKKTKTTKTKPKPKPKHRSSCNQIQGQQNWSMFVDPNQPCMVESGLRCYNFYDILFNNDNNCMQNYNCNSNNNHIFQQQTVQQQQQMQQQQQQQQQPILDGFKCVLPSLHYNEYATPQTANPKDRMHKTETNNEEIKFNVQTTQTENPNPKPKPIINCERHQIRVNDCDIWECDICFKFFKQKHRFNKYFFCAFFFFFFFLLCTIV